MPDFKSTKYRTILGTPGPEFDAQINALLAEGWSLHNKGQFLPDGDQSQVMVLKEALPSAAALQHRGPTQGKSKTHQAIMATPPRQRTVPVQAVPVRPTLPTGSIGNGGRT
jgi:hypothetical protein